MLMDEIRKCNDLSILRKANHLINQKLKILGELKALDFKVDDLVFFETAKGTKMSGVITKIGKRNIKVITSSGQRWNIAASLLTKAAS